MKVLEKLEPKYKEEFNKQNLERNLKNSSLLLPVMILFELFMVIFAICAGRLDSPKRLVYFFSYIFLILISVISLALIKAYRKNIISDKAIWVLTYIYGILLLVWGITISTLDSENHYQAIVLLTVLVTYYYAVYIDLRFCIISMSVSFILYCLSVYLFWKDLNLNQIINLIIYIIVIYFILLVQHNLLMKLFKNVKEVEENNNKLSIFNDKLNDINLKLEKSANFDALTGIYNRLSFNKHSERAYWYCFEKNKNLCYMMMDIDDYKMINDTYGHIIGDECLIELCSFVKEISSNDFFRIGGEEFMSIAIGKTNEEIFEEYEEIRKSVEAKTFTKENIKVTISVGFYIDKPNKDISIDKFFSKADIALYSAKNDGKNKVVDFSKMN